jgi:uncharacterized membrane-anchored protein YhcB (DUF1043 family)
MDIITIFFVSIITSIIAGFVVVRIKEFKLLSKELEKHKKNWDEKSKEIIDIFKERR